MKYTEEEWSKLNNESKGNNEIEIPKQEISDEEIEKAAKEMYNITTGLLSTFDFIEGAKWYREQLKQL
jgi:hypothetical protein